MRGLDLGEDLSSSSNNPLVLSQLPTSVEFPKEYEEFIEIMSLLYKRMAKAINTKEGSVYELFEQGNYQQFFTAGIPYTYRNVYRKSFDLVDLNGGNIPGGATVSFANGITGIVSTTLVYASCTSTANDYFTVVYPDASMQGANLSFTNPLAATALSSVIFVAEYTKN